MHLLDSKEKVSKNSYEIYKFHTQICSISSTGAEEVTPEGQVSSSPIFLDELRCSGDEQSLLDCPTGISEVGLTNCEHSQDVWVRCRGQLVCG